MTTPMKENKSCVESESWQIGEIASGLRDLEAGKTVSYDKVAKWLKSWGKPDETKAPL